MIRGKKILLGITGSIAAYKAAILVRTLVSNGAELRVVMTPLAKEFITPLTLATLSKNPILVDFFDPEDGRWNSHVSMGEWADLYLIAPATANTLAKMAHGVADNLLLTAFLSAKCPVAVAPAMDLDMYRHPATQENIRILAGRGVHIIEPGEGELASGLVGKGRMEEPDRIFEQVSELFKCSVELSGKKIVVTAGPTVENIDPVRYISNYSTGKMGFAIAEELHRRGADVTVVAGKTDLRLNEGIKRVDVTSADQMRHAVLEAFEGLKGGERADAAVLCAAVSDYTPASPSRSKIKKGGETMSLELKKTVDIAAELGMIKGDRILVGFALETDNEIANATEKLKKKNLDFIVLNSLRDEGAGFGTDTNKITILDSSGSVEKHPLTGKKEAASFVVDKLCAYQHTGVSKHTEI